MYVGLNGGGKKWDNDGKNDMLGYDIYGTNDYVLLCRYGLWLGIRLDWISFWILGFGIMFALDKGKVGCLR